MRTRTSLSLSHTHTLIHTQALKLPCFKKAMALNNVDMVVTMNHIDPQSQNETLALQYEAVRKAFPDAPYIILTGIVLCVCVCLCLYILMNVWVCICVLMICIPRPPPRHVLRGLR
jgi:hypothetical protein